MLTSHDKQSAWVLVAFDALMCWFTCHTSNKVTGLHCTQHYKHFALTTTGNDCTLATRLVWLGGSLQNSLIIFYGIATDDSIIWRDRPTLAIFWSLAVHHSHQRSAPVSTTTTTSKGRTIDWLSTVPALFSPVTMIPAQVSDATRRSILFIQVLWWVSLAFGRCVLSLFCSLSSF